MRQFYEEGDINRAFNSLNYLSTITAMVFRTAFELKKGNSWKVLALVFSALAVLQNTYWDIVKDWGLLQRLSNNPYLRDKLILPHRSIYFIAMVTVKLTKRVCVLLHMVLVYYIANSISCKFTHRLWT